MKNITLLTAATLVLVGCGTKDLNSEPKYGKDTGLPSNCRAYIQDSVDFWRSGKYSTEETMEALERNCGANGSLWNHKS